MKGTSAGSWFGSTYEVCLVVQYFEGVRVTLDLNRLYQDGCGKIHGTVVKIPQLILIKSPRGGVWGLYMNPKVRPEKKMAVKAVHKVRDVW